MKFALAMVSDPDILVLDEPTAGMDVTARRHFWDVMRADADADRTIIFATHYLEEAEQFRPADRRDATAVRSSRCSPPLCCAASLWGSGASPRRSERGDPALVATLSATDGVVDVRLDGDRLSLRAADLRRRRPHPARPRRLTYLEIAAPTLETAFTALTEN